jgi:hypothetical protein
MKTQRAYSPSTGRWIEVDVLPGTAKPSAKHRRLGNAFVQVPLKLAAEAASASRTHKHFVFLWLLYEAWRLKSTTIPLPNSTLKQYGVSRKQKMRALMDYEKAGLIKVQREGLQTAVVQLLFQIGHS